MPPRLIPQLCSSRYGPTLCVANDGRVCLCALRLFVGHPMLPLDSFVHFQWSYTRLLCSIYQVAVDTEAGLSVAMATSVSQACNSNSFDAAMAAAKAKEREERTGEICCEGRRCPFLKGVCCEGMCTLLAPSRLKFTVVSIAHDAVALPSGIWVGRFEQVVVTAAPRVLNACDEPVPASVPPDAA